MEIKKMFLCYSIILDWSGSKQTKHYSSSVMISEFMIANFHKKS